MHSKCKYLMRKKKLFISIDTSQNRSSKILKAFTEDLYLKTWCSFECIKELVTILFTKTWENYC